MAVLVRLNMLTHQGMVNEKIEIEAGKGVRLDKLLGRLDKMGKPEKGFFRAVLKGREGELLEIIKKEHESGMIDFTSSLVQLVEAEYIHHRVALEATPRPEELKMRLKGFS